MDNDAENYEKYLNGDNDGLIRLVEKYRGALILYIHGIVRDMFSAEDICEDTFFHIMVKKPRYDIKKASFRTWIYSIARNLAYDRLRRESFLRFSSDESEQETADRLTLEEKYITDERKRVMIEQIKKLSDSDRELIWLAYFEDMTAREIAALRGKSVPAINKALSRAREKLREMMKREGYGNENE